MKEKTLLVGKMKRFKAFFVILVLIMFSGQMAVAQEGSGDVEVGVTIWDFSGPVTDSRDNMTTLSYTLIQDVKGKLTGTGTFEDLSGGDNMTIPVEIKGKVKGKKSIVTLKYKVKGKNAEKDKIQNNLKLELVDESIPYLVGSQMKKLCGKGAGCVKTDDEGISLDVPDGMTGEAVVSINVDPIDANQNRTTLEGRGELILSNGDMYNLSAKGKYTVKKDETQYQLKAADEAAKGIKVNKLKIDEGSDNATFIKGKALGQQLDFGCKPVETVDYVDVERFTGVWYQIARYFNPAEGDLAAVTAEYSLNDDGTLGVLNRGLFGGLDGTPVMIEGFARVVDEETNSKLAVSFTNPAVEREFEFWIIELGEYYSYAVISNSKRSTLYIISRTPTMEESVYQGIIDRLSMHCFDPERIILTPQFDEMPPPETVAFVNIESYMGLWYEIARYPVLFDEDGVAVTAEYTLNDNSTVSLINRSLVGDLDGPPNSIEGNARVVDEETNAKLAVTFDRPELEGFEFPYWIIELDEGYQWAVVSSDTRLTLYILNRTSTMDDDVYEDILYRVVKKGFDADRVELTPQPEE